MYDKDLFDKSPFDRQTAPDNEIAASIDGGISIYAVISMRAATGAVITWSWTVSGTVGLRVPVRADMLISGDAEIVNLYARTRLFPDNVTILGALESAVGTRATLAATIMVSADFYAENLKASVRLPDINVHVAGGVVSEKMGLRFPIPAVDISAFGDFLGDAVVRVPMRIRDIELTGIIHCAPIFEPGAAKLELQGLNLPPGGELIIDTDVLEVLLNGIPDVDAVTGDSEFFQLRPGANRIIFMDGETARNLSVTMVWSNRWL